MSLTISNNPSIFLPSLTKPASPLIETQAPAPSSKASVTISEEAQTRLQQEQATKKTPVSKNELRAIHDRTHGANNPWRNKLISQMNAMGKEAPALSELPSTTDPERLARAKQAAQFLYSAHTTGSTSGTPYSDLSRDALSEIIYDESGEYTDVERYAALRTRKDRDEAFFSQVAQLIFQQDLRPFYKGVLEFYDSLSPVEQSIYTENHRETWQGFLDKAELDLGKLAPDFNVWESLMGTLPVPKADKKP